MIQRGEKICTILSLNLVYYETIRLIKMSLNETCSKVRIDKKLSDALHIENGLKQGEAL
jgi:hypothetical protein